VPSTGLRRPDPRLHRQRRNISTYIEEYKATHSLDVKHLLAGLREMDPCGKVVNNPIRLSNDQPELQFVHKTEPLVVTCLTQIFDYMVSSGLQYSSLCSSQAMSLFVSATVIPKRCSSTSHTPSLMLARSLANMPVQTPTSPTVFARPLSDKYSPFVFEHYNASPNCCLLAASPCCIATTRVGGSQGE
jgi:hypothetical protein